MRIHCEDWALDTDTRQVLRSGEAVHLSPKAFDLLALLLLERPRALPKAQLTKRIWPETFVSETSLATLIAELRSALADDARQPRYIRTVHRHGYAFCGTAVEDPTQAPVAGQANALARLIVGGREIHLAPGTSVLGREPESAVCIDSVRVSRRHARITVSPTGAAIEDLGSKNGTYVNGVRVAGSRPLRDGDAIRLGPESLVFRMRGAPSSTETAPG